MLKITTAGHFSGCQKKKIKGTEEQLRGTVSENLNTKPRGKGTGEHVVAREQFKTKTWCEEGK